MLSPVILTFLKEISTWNLVKIYPILYLSQVLQNLLETERTYVKELQNLVGVYIKPLQPQTTPGGEGIPASDIRILSGNMQAIIDFQLKFVKELEDCSK